MQLHPQGTIVRDFATGRTNLPGIYAGGDGANGGSEVVDAVAEGKRAARGIHLDFTGRRSRAAGPDHAAGGAGTAGGRGFNHPVRVSAIGSRTTSGTRIVADLSIDFCGIRSPNPFWIASGPPANTAYQAHRAFEAGWGGVVWKTIGEPIVNVSSRYSAMDLGGQNMVGFNNIELISDRSPETNFAEIREVKDRWPDHAVIASLMTDTRENWHDFMKRSADSGADGVELNFGCPHGMCERGMGSAVGQNPDVIETIVGWVMEVAHDPGHREADPEHHRHHRARPGGQAGGGGRDLADQHHQQHHPGEPGHLVPRNRWWTDGAPMAATVARR